MFFKVRVILSGFRSLLVVIEKFIKGWFVGGVVLARGSRKFLDFIGGFGAEGYFGLEIVIE